VSRECGPALPTRAMVNGYLPDHHNQLLTTGQVVCQYFLRGACKFGSQCRNEHPQNAQGDRRSAIGGVLYHLLSRSLLIIFQGQHGPLRILRRLFRIGMQCFNLPVGFELTPTLSLDTMTRDFDVRADKPSWSLSSYGPAKNEKNLLPALDESPEELRLKVVTAMRNGNTNEYVCYHLCIWLGESLIVQEIASI